MKNKAAVALGRLGGNKNTPLQLEKRRQNMAKATADRIKMRADMAAEIHSEPEKKVKKKS